AGRMSFDDGTCLADFRVAADEEARMDGFPIIRTIAEAAALLKAGDLSPVELTKACLERIDRLDFTLRAFVRVLAPQALKAAREAEAEIAAGNYRGPLHGIPIGLKDIIDVAGVPT